jgi:hypothetical protein
LVALRGSLDGREEETLLGVGTFLDTTTQQVNELESLIQRQLGENLDETNDLIFVEFVAENFPDESFKDSDKNRRAILEKEEINFQIKNGLIQLIFIRFLVDSAIAENSITVKNKILSYLEQIIE